jgi:hypothetical protein
MDRIRALLRLALWQRLGSPWLVACVAAGILVSAALMASVSIYSGAVRDLGLAYTLRSQPSAQLAIQVSSGDQSARPPEYQSRRDLTARLLNEYAGPIIRATTRAGRSAPFALTDPGQPVTRGLDRPLATFQFFEHLNQHVRLVEGRWPSATPPPSDSGERMLEVLIGQAAAERLSLQPGRSFDLHAAWDRVRQPPLHVTVAGVIAAGDPENEYWHDADPFAPVITSGTAVSFVVDESVFTDALAFYLPDTGASFQTFAFVDISRIDARNAVRVEANLRALTAALRQNIERTSAETGLIDTLAAYRQRLFFTRAPLLALMAQVVGIALYYLGMVATLLAEGQAGEIALLRSRGNAPREALIVYAVKGGALAVLGAVVAPLLAAGAITALGSTPPFRDLSGGRPLRVHVSAEALALAAAGALLALAALLWAAYRATHRTIVQQRREIGRPQAQPAFQKYYVDVFLIAVAAIAFAELRQRGSLVTQRLFGGLSADPLMLLAPSLFMLTIALLFLRLFPLALEIVMRVARRTSGAVLSLALARMARAPAYGSRLILLVILTSAVGLFAAGFRATLERSYEDRIAYQAGSELRVEGIREPHALAPAELADAVAVAAGGGQGTPAWRTRGAFSDGRDHTTDLTVLGVRPADFAQHSYWRGDFSERPLPELLGRLHDSSTMAPTAVVPPGSAWIGVWVWTRLPFDAAGYGVRLVDNGGVVSDYPLVGPGRERYRAGEWQFLVADLRHAGAAPTATLRLHSLFVRVAPGPPTRERVSVFFDGLQATATADLPGDWWSTGFHDGRIVEGFESLDGYEVMSGGPVQPEAGAVNRSDARVREGGYAAQVTFPRPRRGQVLYGVRIREDAAPLAILVSETFLDGAGRRVGDEVQIVVNDQPIQARIVGRFRLFPTYYPDGNGAALVVADLDRLLHLANRVAGTAPAHANEVWMGDRPPRPVSAADLRERGLSFDTFTDLSTLRAAQRRDPLVAASWEGILFLSFAAVFALTVLGVTVHSCLSAQTRAVEFGILRTMGFSGRQILALVALEHASVVVAGAAVGTLLGLPLGRLMLGYMAITETGAAVVPPFVSEVSWRAVAIPGGLLALVLGVDILILARLYARLAVPQALRSGETM